VVEVIVDKQTSAEYAHDEDVVGGCVVTKYIEAQTGKNFVVKVTYSLPFPEHLSVALALFLDGQEIAQTFRLAADLYEPRGHTYPGPICKIGTKSFQQKLHFKELAITEDTGGLCT
jgi:hypothetical protein